MLRRAIPSVATASVARRAATAAAPVSLTAARAKSVHMSVPLGSPEYGGKVIKAKYDYVRPAFSTLTILEYCTIFTLWGWSISWPICIGVASVIFGWHGIIPFIKEPDPHALHP